MAYVEVVSTTQTSITVRLAGLDTGYALSDRICEWHLDGVYDGRITIAAYASYSGTYTFSWLTAGKQYTIRAFVYPTSLQWSDSFYATASTNGVQHVKPSITSFTVAQTSEGSHYASCSCRVSSLESDATYKIEVMSSNGTWWEKVSGYAASSFSATIELDEYRTYSVRITVTNYSGYYDTYTTTVTMLAKAFAWTYPKVRGYDFILTAAEWNDLWSAIESRLGYSYSHTRAYSGYTFTAEMYNQAVAAIGRGNTVSKGDTITADLMNQLVTNVNRM